MPSNWFGQGGPTAGGYQPQAQSQGLYGQIGQALPQMGSVGGAQGSQGLGGLMGGMGSMGGGQQTPESMTIKFAKNNQGHLWALIAKMLQQQMGQGGQMGQPGQRRVEPSTGGAAPSGGAMVPGADYSNLYGRRIVGPTGVIGYAQ